MVAAAIVGSAVVGAYASNAASSKAADAQNRATDAATRSADEAAQLNREKFDYDKKVYEEDVRPAQQKAQDLQNRIGEEALSASQQQRKFAADQQQYYKDTFQPVEKKMVDEANNYDSQENVDRRSGIAAANVNQQFSNVRGQSARLAGRYGLGSSAMSGMAGSSERAQALGSAGAQTGAAFDTMDKGLALRAGAANFGRNMPNTAATFSAVGNQSAGLGANAGSAALNSSMAGANFMNGAYQQNIGNTTAIGAGLAGAYQNSANMYNAAAASNARFTGSMIGLASNGNGGGGGSGGGWGLGNRASSWWGTDASPQVSNEVSSMGSSTSNPFSDYNTGANGWGSYGE